MAGYDISLSSGTLLTTVNVKTIDDRAHSSLVLIGQGIPNYGDYVAQDFVWLLENFAKNTPPPHPLIGQQWYNTDTGQMNVFSAGGWVLVSSDTATTGFSGLTEDGTGGLVLQNPTGTTNESYFSVVVGDQDISMGALDDGEAGPYISTSKPTITILAQSYTLVDGAMKLTPLLFADLLALVTPAFGMIACISDSTTNVWGAVIAGLGANKVLGFYDGTNWTVFAK